MRGRRSDILPYPPIDAGLHSGKSKLVDKTALAPFEEHGELAFSSKGVRSYRSTLSSARLLESLEEGTEAVYGGNGAPERAFTPSNYGMGGIAGNERAFAQNSYGPRGGGSGLGASARGFPSSLHGGTPDRVFSSVEWSSGSSAIAARVQQQQPNTGFARAAMLGAPFSCGAEQAVSSQTVKTTGLWPPIAPASSSAGDVGITIARQSSGGSFTESLLSSDLMPPSTFSTTISTSASDSTLLGNLDEDTSKENGAKLPGRNASSYSSSSQSWAQLTEQRYNLQLALALRLVATADLTEEPFLTNKNKESCLSSGASQCSPASTALRFWVNGSLGYSDKIQDGFYQIWGMNPHIWALCSDAKEGGRMPSLDMLRKVDPSCSSIEVVLFDKHGDSHLRDLENMARSLANKATSANELAESLGKLVCSLMGGAALTEDTELVSRWKASSSLLKDCVSSLVIPVGSLSVGLCRHRALLYKALADCVDLPCRIIRGCKYCGLTDGTSCLVLCGPEREWLVDLIAKPGDLGNAEAFLRSLQATSVTSPLRLPDLKVSQMVNSQARLDSDLSLQVPGVAQLGSVDKRSLKEKLGVSLPFNGPATARLGNVWPGAAPMDSECKSSSLKVALKPDLAAMGYERLLYEGRNLLLAFEPPIHTAGKYMSGDVGEKIASYKNLHQTVVQVQNHQNSIEPVNGSIKALKVQQVASEIETPGRNSRKQVNPDLSLALDGFEIPWDDLRLQERIGAGSFGTVHRADWHGSDVAVKILIEQDFHEERFEEFVREVGLMKRMRHPNVVLFMGAVTKRPNFSIVTEYLPRGSLFRLLHRAGVRDMLDEKRRIRMALDVARGMNYLHRLNPPIVHRDLKSPNLLVDKTWTVKVCDFGLSRFKGNTFLSSRSAAGTPEWMAPEVLRDEPSNEKSDIYSFGIILWELVTLQQPWNGLSPAQVVGAVGFQNRRLQIPKEATPEIASLIEACFSDDPRHRPSFAAIMDSLKSLQKLIVTGNCSNA